MRRLEAVEEALLYLAAGFDANAALTAAAIGPPDASEEAPIAEWALQRIRALLDGTRPVPGTTPPDAPGELRRRARHGVWRRVGQLVEAHVRWLRLQRDDDPGAASALQELAELLAPGSRPAAHSDLHHLALLLAVACDDTAARALRRIPSPPDDGGRFADYQRARAAVGRCYGRRPSATPSRRCRGRSATRS